MPLTTSLRVLALAPLLALAPALPVPPALAASAELPDPGAQTRIVAVVNGDVISAGDVDNRRRLFALSTGLPMSQEVLARLTPQVLNQLIDERLRLQEIERRKIVIPDKRIADSIAEIEKQNNMPVGALRERLARDGVALRTLIDQIRAQLGWTQVLREQLGDKAHISDAEIAARERELKAEIGKPEYHLSEIFVPVTDPSHEAEARRFADTIIQQLHNGAPYAVVAAQFSQSQTALQGGDRGWVRADQVDPEIARIIAQMPAGAISNPIHVAGGFSIVAMRAKRQMGNDPATLLKVRQIFLPFTSTLDPTHPTQQQIQQLKRAKQIETTVRGCDQMEVAGRGTGDAKHPPTETEVRLETVSPPQLQTMLASLSIGTPSRPLVAREGILEVMVCSKEVKNLAAISRDEVMMQLLSQRVELTSRQLLRDLQRRAVIERRAGRA